MSRVIDCVFGEELATKITLIRAESSKHDADFLLVHEPYRGWSTRTQILLWASLDKATYEEWLLSASGPLNWTVNPFWGEVVYENDALDEDYDPDLPTIRTTKGIESFLIPNVSRMDLETDPYVIDKERFPPFFPTNRDDSGYPILLYKYSVGKRDPRIFIVARQSIVDLNSVELLIDFYL